MQLQKKISSLNDYSTLYSKNINLKKSEKNENGEQWGTLKSKYTSDIYEKSTFPDKTHLNKEYA